MPIGVFSDVRGHALLQTSQAPRNGRSSMPYDDSQLCQLSLNPLPTRPFSLNRISVFSLAVVRGQAASQRPLTGTALVLFLGALPNTGQYIHAGLKIGCWNVCH